MRKALVEILTCPYCATDDDLLLLVAEGNEDAIARGALECKSCKRQYPVIDDIPYFSLHIAHKGIKNQFETYSEWWNDYHDETVVIDPQNPQYFFNSLRIQQEEYTDKYVLDAGCGNGRFSYVASKLSPRLHVCFDISSGLKHARSIIAKHNPSAPISFVQGDITLPPFKKSTFDIVFSWGVIHHTPNTYETFKSLSGVVKNNGKLAIYVYEFHPYYAYNKQLLLLVALLRSNLVIRPIRFILSRLPSFCAKSFFFPVFAIQKIFRNGFLGWLFGINLSGNFSMPSKRFFSVVMDRFKTRYATEHTLEEVLNWFHRNGFNDLHVGSYPPVSIQGKKSPDNDVLRISIHKK